MKESLSKHNSLQQYLNDRRIAETKATGVDQEIDCEYNRKIQRQLQRQFEALGIDMNLFKHKDSRMFNMTDKVQMLFDFILDEVLVKSQKTYRTSKKISPKKFETLLSSLIVALQSCNVPGKEIKRQIQTCAKKLRMYQNNKNSPTKCLTRRLPAQYFRGTSLEMTPVVGNDPTLSEEEFRNAYELPISPLEI